MEKCIEICRMRIRIVIVVYIYIYMCERDGEIREKGFILLIIIKITSYYYSEVM